MKRRQLKLFILAGLVTACLLALLVWSSPAAPIPGTTPEKVTLKLLMVSPEVPQWKSLAQALEAANPDLHLELVEGPADPNGLEDLYTAAFLLGNSPYDLVYMDVTWAPKFAAAGWLREVGDRLSPQEVAEFLPGNLNGGRYQGKLYRIPFRSDVGVLYYRKDLLDQAGYKPPETFAELLTISQALQQQRKATWGYLWQGRQYEGSAAMFVEVLQGFGGFWIDPDTRAVGLDQPQAIQAVEFLRGTIAQGISPPGVVTYREEETRRAFQGGEAVFLRNWPYVWTLANAKDSAVRGNIGITSMVHAPGYAGGGCQGGWGLGISSTTKHPEAAWRAVQFLTSAESQQQFSLERGYLPARRTVFTDRQIVQKYPYFPDLLKLAERPVLRPPAAQYAQASDILQRYLSATLTGRMTPQQAMTAAANETRRLLG